MTSFYPTNKLKTNHVYELVVFGGSWGGMDAIIKILSNIPVTFPLPIVVVLHRQKDQESDLVRILKKYIKLKVKEVDEKDSLNPGSVYIAPQNYHLLLERDKTFSLCVSEFVHYSRPSIDVFFESAAVVFRDKVIGVLLTGANEDGSEGIKTISDNGGFTIIQDPEDAESPYMPINALKKVKPDFIFTRQEIAEFLMKLI